MFYKFENDKEVIWEVIYHSQSGSGNRPDGFMTGVTEYSEVMFIGRNSKNL